MKPGTRAASTLVEADLDLFQDFFPPPVLVLQQLEEERRLMEGGTFPAGNGVASLVGKLSVRQSASLIKASDAFVGNDSGLAHVAGAVGTRGIVIGYHVTRTWYPSSPGIQTIIKVPGCTSCDLSACVGNTGAASPCFRAVSVPEVMERLLPLLPGRL